jgi:hypothetical protein
MKNVQQSGLIFCCVLDIVAYWHGLTSVEFSLALNQSPCWKQIVCHIYRRAKSGKVSEPSEELFTALTKKRVNFIESER